MNEENNKLETKEITVSQARNIIEIAKNVRKKTEIIRENTHNASDAFASEEVINIDYSEGNLNLTFWHNGNSFNTVDEIISALFHVSETNKIEGKDIGAKGVGFKLNLDCKEVKITSCVNSIKITVTVKNPILQLEEIVKTNKKGYIQYKYQIKEVQSEELVNKGVRIELLSVEVSDVLEFSHEKLIEQIVFFTTIALDKFNKRNFRIYLKGLEFKTTKLNNGTSEEIQVEDILESYNNSNYGIIKSSIKSKDVYEVLERGYLSRKIDALLEKYKNNIIYFDSDGRGFEKYKPKYDEIKKICKLNNVQIDFFVLQSTNREFKRELNPLLGRNDIFKIAENEFMGIYLSKLGILVPTRMNFNTLAGGGSGQTQYFGVFNCDNIFLKIDRNELGSSNVNNVVEKIIKDNIMSIIDNIVKNDKKFNNKKFKNEKLSDKKKTVGTLKAPADNNIDVKYYNDNLGITRKAINVILKLKTMNVVNPEGDQINILDGACEIDLHSMIRLALYFEPKILEFKILYTNPNKGIDLFCLPLEIEINESNLYTHGFWVELKHTLKAEFNHNMMDLKMIICWEMGDELKYKNKYLTDTNKQRYNLRIENNKYFLINDNQVDNRKIEIIEFKNIMEKVFRSKFR